MPYFKKQSGFLKILLLIILVPVFLIGGFFYFATAQLRMSDDEVLKSYKPSSEVLDLAEKNTLTDKGKAALYRADPQFVDNEAFIKYCKTVSRGIEALACIAPKPGGGPFGGKQIFLLKIDDPKFSDHKYAASVHEMLHSAYMRFSSEEKDKLAPLLLGELEKHKDDPHLANIVELLKQKKGINDFNDELHSKFGTEYKSLSPGLEEHYKQYFNDRNKVVENYEKGGFNSRIRRVDQLNGELKSLKAKLESGKTQELVGEFNTKVAEHNKIIAEIETFYKLFRPDSKSPEVNY